MRQKKRNKWSKWPLKTYRYETQVDMLLEMG